MQITLRGSGLGLKASRVKTRPCENTGLQKVTVTPKKSSALEKRSGYAAFVD